MEDKIKEILMRKFDGVYCDSCMCESQGDTEPCDSYDSHCEWRISEEYAEQIVKEIMEVGIVNKSISLKSDSEHEVIKELYNAGFTEEQITALTKWIITLLQYE